MAATGADIEVVKRLLAEVVDSFEKLEIVVHVHRAGMVLKPEAELAKALSLPADEIAKCVKVLEREGAFDAGGRWRTAIDALVAMYDEDRIEVLNLMTRTALQRVRKEAARVFADAFVLRPKKKGDPDA